MIRFRLLQNPLALVSLFVLALACVIVAAAPWLAVDQGVDNDSPLNTQLLAPSYEHPFGTDHLGRDLYARVLFAGRYSLPVGPIVVGLSILISLPLGSLAGYRGGAFDDVMMRLTDVFLSFPQLLFAIALAAALGASFQTLILALVLTWWPWYVRLVRTQALALRQREYVVAAIALGADPLHILIRHIVPNALTPILMQATSDFGAAILSGTALSFLGLGVQPPAADWGQLVSDGRAYFPDHWWYATFPGGAIFIVAFAFGLLGDAVHSALNLGLKR